MRINYGNNFTSSCLLVLCCIFNAVPDLVWSQPEGKIRYTPKTCFREVIVSFMSTLHAVWRFLSDVREFWGNELFRWFPLTLHQWFHPQLETLLPCCPVNTYAPHFSCRTKINRLATSVCDTAFDYHVHFSRALIIQPKNCIWYSFTVTICGMLLSCRKLDVVIGAGTGRSFSLGKI